MNNIELNKYKDIVENVIQYARQENNNYTDGNRKKMGDIDLYEAINRRNGSKLWQYLNSLDYDTIKIVEVMMYVGRDYSIISEEGIENEEIKHLDTPLEFFTKIYDDFSDRGWESQSIVVEQIYGKAPLDKYLERAVKLLYII